MSAEEDFYFQTLRIDRIEAKLAMAEAIVGLANQGRVENANGIEALARAFNLMPPSFGVGQGQHERCPDGQHGAEHSHGHGEETDGHPHPHPHQHQHPHPHPHAGGSHGPGPAESDASGIGLATLIARASAEMAETNVGPGTATRPGADDGPGGADTRSTPRISRVGLLTAAGATEIRLAVLRAKIALAEAVAVASKRADEPLVCSWIHSLTTAFDELPAPLIVVAETDENE